MKFSFVNSLVGFFLAHSKDPFQHDPMISSVGSRSSLAQDQTFATKFPPALSMVAMPLDSLTTVTEDENEKEVTVVESKKTTATTTTIVQEIEQVQIKILPEDNDNGLLHHHGLGSFLQKTRPSYYVSFLHTPTTGLEPVNSLPLTLSSNELHEGKAVEEWSARVDLHLQAENDDTKPKRRSLVQCNVYEKAPLFFLPARKIGTTDFWIHNEDSNDSDSDDVNSSPNRKMYTNRLYHPKTGNLLEGMEISLSTQSRRWNSLFAENWQPPIENEPLEGFFKLFAKALNEVAKQTNNPTSNNIPLPTEKKNPKLELVGLLGGAIKYAKNDEFSPMKDWERMAIKFATGFEPKDNRNSHYKDLSDGIFQIRKTINTALLKPKEGWWENPTSDAAMKRTFFSSFGMLHHLRRTEENGGGYVSDLRYLSKYKYREGKFEKYGTKTYFDMDGNILKIEDPDGTLYHPNPDKTDPKLWEWAKLKSRTSSFTVSSLLHVTEFHYKWGSVACVGLRMFLSPDHPIRRVFSVHFFKTAYTCSLAEPVLAKEDGLLAFGTSFDFKEGLEQILKDQANDFRFSCWPSDVKERGLDNCPFHVAATDGVDLHRALSEYVSGFLDTVYNGNQDLLDKDAEMQDLWKHLVENLKGVPEECTIENLKMVWSEILFRVTGQHNAVGQVTLHALDPSVVNIRLQSSRSHQDLVTPMQSAMTVASVVSVTKVDKPTLGQDWSHVFKTDAEREVYDKLRHNLNQLEAIIDERNKHRPTNIDYHPQFAGIAIST